MRRNHNALAHANIFSVSSHDLIEIALEELAHSMFVEGGSNLLADELLTIDIEQSPHVGYVIRKEFEGVFVYWVILSGIMTILEVGKLKGQRVCFGEIATIRHHLDGVNGRTWIFDWTSNALRKGDVEFVQKLGAVLLGHIIDIIITIGAHR